MLIAFVESRPKARGKSDVWEDVLLARVEMAAPPHVGWVIRLPTLDGSRRRYRVREIAQDLPLPGDECRVTEQELLVYVVSIPPSGTLDVGEAGPRSLFEQGRQNGTSPAPALATAAC